MGAYFYQLKPIWQESFYRLMDSVLRECLRNEKNSLILRCKTGITRLELDKLKYCEVTGRNLLLHKEDGEVLDSVGKLDDLCEQLKDYECFVRCHRSYMINMDYVKSNGKLVIGITDFAPMDYKEDGSDEWVGFDADMAKAFAESLGVKAEFIEINWDNKIMELDSKNVDVLWNGMTLTDEVKNSMECTNPYFNNAQVVVTAGK